MIYARHLLRNMSLDATNERFGVMSDAFLTVDMRYRIPGLAEQFPQHMWVEGEPEFETIAARVRIQILADITAIYGRGSYHDLAYSADPFTGLPLVTWFWNDQEDWDYSDDYDPTDCNPVGRCLALGLGQDRTLLPWSQPRETDADAITAGTVARGGLNYVDTTFPQYIGNMTNTTWTNATEQIRLARLVNANSTRNRPDRRLPRTGGGT